MPMPATQSRNLKTSAEPDEPGQLVRLRECTPGGRRSPRVRPRNLLRLDFMKRFFVPFLKGLLLVVAYAVLFAAGSALLLPASSLGEAAPADGADALLPLLAIALIDVAVMVGIVVSSRLAGWRLWTLVSLVVYGAKTFTSQLESAYFMKNVTTRMLPGLFLMTLPAIAIVAALAVKFFGQTKKPGDAPAWRIPRMSPAEWTAKLFVLSAIAYPVLFSPSDTSSRFVPKPCGCSTVSATCSRFFRILEANSRTTRSFCPSRR